MTADLSFWVLGADGEPLRGGAGLMSSAPLSDETRILAARGEVTERREDEAEADQRREDAEGRRWALEHAGVQPHTVSEVLQNHAIGQDRKDRREQANQHDADCGCVTCSNARYESGRPEPRPLPAHLAGLDRQSLERKHAEAAVAEQVTPATVAEVKAVGNRVTKLAAKLWAATGRT